MAELTRVSTREVVCLGLNWGCSMFPNYPVKYFPFRLICCRKYYFKADSGRLKKGLQPYSSLYTHTRSLTKRFQYEMEKKCH